jgi:hypothetical protein
VVNATPCPTLLLGKRTDTYFAGSLVGFRALWMGAANLAPTGIRFPNLPTPSELLYKLSYPDPLRIAYSRPLGPSFTQYIFSFIFIMNIGVVTHSVD